MRRRRTAALLAAVVAVAPLLAAPPASARHGGAISRTDAIAEGAALHPPTAGAVRNRITLWANGSTTATVRLEHRAFRLLFDARATWCDGPAELEVRVDGELRMRRPVADEGRYAVVGDWAPGEHHLSFRFTNDHRTAACDRNVSIGRQVSFTGPHDPTEDVPSSHRIVSVRTETDLGHAAVAPVTAGKVGQLYGTVGFWQAELWGRGTLAVELDAQGDDLYLYGSVESCDGPPEVEVRVDGRTVHTGPSSDRGSLRVRDAFPPGSPLLHRVEVELLNPHRGDGCQRRVRFERIWFQGVV